jgi:K+-transporting ATPase ATPase B chain
LSYREPVFIKFTAETRSSGRRPAGWHPNPQRRFDAIRKMVEAAGNPCPAKLAGSRVQPSPNGGTPLVVAENEQVIGVIELQDM